MSKKRKLSARSIKRKVTRALALQEKGKLAYSKAEMLIKEIGERSKAGELIDIGTGTLYEVVDQFKEGDDLVWAHAAARRWKLREVSKRTAEAMRKSA